MGGIGLQAGHRQAPKSICITCKVHWVNLFKSGQMSDGQGVNTSTITQRSRCDAFSRVAGVMLQRVGNYLENLWSLSGRVSNPAAVRENHTMRLAKGQVMVIHKASGIQRVEMASGTVWLTGTPSEGDVVLAAGSVHEFGEGWPYVVQALDDANLFMEAGGTRIAWDTAI